MKRYAVVAVAAAGLVLSACGSGEEATAQVCDGVAQAQKGLSSLASSTPDTVGAAKKRLADVQADIEQASADAPIAQQAVLTTISQALTGIEQSLASVKDNAQVPESITQAVDSVNATIDTAATTLGCG